jgi:hypothetical protein
LLYFYKKHTYVCFAQTSLKDANNAFKNKIVKILEVDDKILEELLKLIKDIFNEYPKWIKRGNI